MKTQKEKETVAIMGEGRERKGGRDRLGNKGETRELQRKEKRHVIPDKKKVK